MFCFGNVYNKKKSHRRNNNNNNNINQNYTPADYIRGEMRNKPIESKKGKNKKTKQKSIPPGVTNSFPG
jgi:hypothetical protein